MAIEKEDNTIDLNENSEGVHGMNPINGEYTLCGYAFDEPAEDFVPTEDGDIQEGWMKRTDKKLVTCPKCIIVIKAARAAKFRSS